MKLKWTLSTLALALFVSSIVLAVLNTPKTETQIIQEPEWVAQDPYNKNIKPILEAKCIACHACYNSPCQLNMTSYEGLIRGASQVNPYDFPLTHARQATRLGIDADTTKQWREFGFYDVVGNEQRSLLLTALNAKRDDEYQQINFEAEKSRTCLKPSFVPVITLTGSNQELSMPYGLPRLSSDELKTIENWVKSGAPGPSNKVTSYEAETHTPGILKEIKEWEDRLNGTSAKKILSARYFYEHLFIAHIYFNPEDREFFRLVRAENRKGPVQEIPTDRPYDPIEGDFYYRFKLINQSIVVKNHTTFLLDEREKNRFETEFLKGDWNLELNELPDYGPRAANPFLTFQTIPRKVRYKFFLDNARYFIMTFMKGPVCRGQTALNVINDHFWVLFLDPEFDLSAKLDEPFNQFAELMTPPASKEDQVGFFNKLRKNRWKANSKKWDLYKQKNITFNEKAIWDGDGHDPNSSLTIYRHFDSADVVFGHQGAIPQTVWVIDYQIFEDIYYNLVAGYNLFGPILHQANTRLYMELSRITSEDMFLTFLPEQERTSLRENWNQEAPELSDGLAHKFLKIIGKDAQTQMQRKFPFQSKDVNSAVHYKTKNYKNEFIQLVRERLPNKNEYKYRWDEQFFKESRAQAQIQTPFHELTNLRGPFYEVWPEVALIRVVDDSTQSNQVYSMIANRGHYNVNMLFLEDKRRWEERDHFDFIKGHATSYPNFYFVLQKNEVSSFIDMTQSALKDPSGKAFKELQQKFGISRFDPDFWSEHAKFNEAFKNQRPVEYGALDLNRYLSL